MLCRTIAEGIIANLINQICTRTNMEREIITKIKLQVKIKLTTNRAQ